ncbi:MAG TPA: DNA recombination protein RmuC [Mycobacteriales bacterium]|nr:DNA recombination protein RmuC [Mycobacteriales bacterium]
MNLAEAILAIATLALGFGIGAQVARSRSAGEAAAARSERDAAALDRENLRGEYARAHDELERLRGELGSVSSERDRLRSDLDASALELRTAAVHLAEAQTLLKSQEQLEAQFKDAFVRLSQESLQAGRKELLELADDRFRQAGRPLTETLGKVEAQLREIEQKREGAQATLAQQIEFVRTTGEQLRTETAALVSALRKPQARGQWGELTLRRCLDHAGMLDRCDFVEQDTLATPGGMLRPDLVVRLVGGKNIVVDAKVTLSAFLDAYEAESDIVREERLTAHAKHLRQHVDSLASKAYWEHLSPAPEFVVLFVPGDAFLAAALDRDGSLLDDALRKRVHIATPTTLISVLRTVAYVWQQDALAKNAQTVFDLGKELYARLGTFSGHMGNVGSQLSKSVKAYNDAVRSLEGRLLVTARRFKDLDLVDDDLAELELADDAIQTFSRPELVATPDQPGPVISLNRPSEDLDRIDDYGINVPNETERDRRTGS